MKSRHPNPKFSSGGTPKVGAYRWGEQKFGPPVKEVRTVVFFIALLSISAPMSSHLEIRVGDNTDITQNAVCYYYDNTMTKASQERWNCYVPLKGRYVSVQKVAGVPNKQLVFAELRVFQPVH